MEYLNMYYQYKLLGAVVAPLVFVLVWGVLMAYQQLTR